MLTYNTRLTPLVLPEYGRNIQQMVDRCLEIEDRDERTRAAYTIIESMMILVPDNGEGEERLRKLWDHLWIMSGCKLDVDFPFEHIDVSIFKDKPEHVSPRLASDLKFHHYGRLIQEMVDKACSMEDSPEKDSLVYLLASQLKKTIVMEYGDDIEDEKIVNEIRKMSHGALNLDISLYPLPEFVSPDGPLKKKKKK